MAALNPPSTTTAVADMDIEPAVNRLAGDLDLVLLLNVGLLDRATAVGTGVGQRSVVDFVDVRRRRWRSVAFTSVLSAGLAAGLFGLVGGLALGEGGGLAFAGAEGFGELRFEFGDASAEGFTTGTDGAHTFSVAGGNRLSCASLPPEALNNDEQSKKDAEKYVPVLPAVKERALRVDPKKGYLVKEVKPGVFVITDGSYQSAFVTTGKGVILFDAPPSITERIERAVADVTKEQIRQIVYSHSHLDHIAGTELLLKNIPNLEIIAERGVSDFLKEKKDRRRPAPTTTFNTKQTLSVGSAKIELKRGNWHSNEDDLFIYIPDKRFLMAIDPMAAGYVPFMNLDLTSNFHNYLKVFDELLAYDFDVLVAGHLTSLATREDVRQSKEYVLAVYKTVKRIHDGADQKKLMAEGAEKYTWDNQFALFRTVLDDVIDKSYEEIKGRWIDKLAGVDVWGRSHCRTAIIYVRWDD
jgi:glyoxylase-like metal-dependent hydrolase (beta-lactamase superfamily II)